MSFLQNLVERPADPIMGLNQAFMADERESKVNLGVGVYKTNDLKLVLSSAVHKAEEEILTKGLARSYLPIDGDKDYLKCALELIFGENNEIVTRAYAAQTPGGTGALRVIAEFLAQEKFDCIYLSRPTWANHKPIFEAAGLNVFSYSYYDDQKHVFNLEQTLDAIKNMERGQAILLHACCHNPTGEDPTSEQWKLISEQIKEKGLFPVFDFAYHGFGDGLDKDPEVLKIFTNHGHAFCLAYSFSKNFNLYGERIGLMAIVAENNSLISKIASNIKVLIRRNYSNPPIHGAHIVKTVLNSLELRDEWKQELDVMRFRIINMRKELFEKLNKSNIDFSFINRQKGLFSLCGLNADQVAELVEKRGVYMPSSGRINIAGLTSHNIDYVADSIISVL